MLAFCLIIEMTKAPLDLKNEIAIQFIHDDDEILSHPCMWKYKYSLRSYDMNYITPDER